MVLGSPLRVALLHEFVRGADTFNGWVQTPAILAHFLALVEAVALTCQVIPKLSVPVAVFTWNVALMGRPGVRLIVILVCDSDFVVLINLFKHFKEAATLGLSERH